MGKNPVAFGNECSMCNTVTYSKNSVNKNPESAVETIASRRVTIIKKYASSYDQEWLKEQIKESLDLKKSKKLNCHLCHQDGHWKQSCPDKEKITTKVASEKKRSVKDRLGIKRQLQKK